LRCLAALETPLIGKITVNGLDTDRAPRKIHAISGYLSDFYGLYDQLTVAQNLTYFALSRNVAPAQVPAVIRAAAKRLEIWTHKNTLAGKLSRGLRQRLAIAQSILHKPQLLFLDEPASGLDPEARFHLSQLLLELQKEGMTIIVSSHILAELEDYSTHMLVIDEGKINSDLYQIKGQTRSMQEIYLQRTKAQPLTPPTNEED
jgi:ABC-2 type transport system ATP-binding protein